MSTSPAARELLEAFIATTNQDRAELDEAQPAHRAVLTAEPALQAELVGLVAEELSRPPGGGLLGRLLGRHDHWTLHALQALLARLLRGAPPLDEAQLLALLEAQRRESAFPIPLAGPLRAIERQVAAHGLTAPLERSLRALEQRLAKEAYPSAETRKLRSRVDALLGATGETPALPLDRDAWGGALAGWVESQAAATRDRWAGLLQHAAQASGKSKPTQRWSRRADELVAALGGGPFVERLQAWMDSAKLGYTHLPEWGEAVEVGLSDANQELLKGLVWAAASLGDAELAHAVARFGERCFRKIPGFGAASSKLGNACIHALAAMPGGVGVAHLSRLGEKVRYASGKRILERSLDGAAARAGQTREDLEELAVPDGGLDAQGVRRVAVGEHQAELRVAPGSGVELRWLRPDGRPQASVPKAVREAHADSARALKKEQKQLADLLDGQTARLQRLWMIDRRLPLADLRRRYLEHPLVGQLGRRLIWLAEHEGRREELFWQDGRLAPLGGGEPALPDEAEARLWHVLDCAELERLLVWRDHLEAQQVQQPFKQVWREVYRPRDPAASADDRYSGHIVKQHPLRNLCQQRGWQYAIQGYWDSQNYPTLRLPRWGLSVTLEADALAHQDDGNYIFAYLVIGAVRFHRADADAVDDQPLPLGEVPPLVFSEVLRDVDLFVGVSTVANEPRFDAAGIKEDWRRYWGGAVFGELLPIAETRREVLARVLPRTILRERARLEDRWLVVGAGAGEHRIHLGTAQVRREGSEDPVPVEADREARARAGSVFLPFEGDAMLTNILAKAFVLSGE